MLAAAGGLGYLDYFTMWSVADYAFDGAQAEIDRINTLPTDVPYSEWSQEKLRVPDSLSL